jgi:hypothetical protein
MWHNPAWLWCLKCLTYMEVCTPAAGTLVIRTLSMSNGDDGVVTLLRVPNHPVWELDIGQVQQAVGSHAHPLCGTSMLAAAASAYTMTSQCKKPIQIQVQSAVACVACSSVT